MTKKNGILYALHNDLWLGYVKCGLTTQKIEKRISNLQTSLFIDCKIIATTNELINCKVYEYILQKILNEYRLRSDREFFNIDVDTIKEIFETFNYINSVLDTEEKLKNYITNNYPEYFYSSKKIKSKKTKGIFIDTTY